MKRVLDVLREDCGSPAPKKAAARASAAPAPCSSTALPVNSCLVPAAHLDGADVMTIEGVADGTRSTRCRRRLSCEGGAQCGICTPGMIMAALDVPRGATTERDPGGAGGQPVPLHGIRSDLSGGEGGKG